MKLRAAEKTRFLKDSSILQGAAVLIAGGNFLSAVALTHILGAQKQGEFYLAIALYSFLWVLVNLGLFQVTVSQVASAHARGNEYKVAAWLAYLAKSYVLIGALVTAVGWLALPTVVEEFFDRDPRVGLYAALLATTPLLELPRVVALAGLQGTRRMLAVARIENGQEVARVFLVVTGAFITDSPLGPVVGMLAASALGSLLAVDLYRRERDQDGVALPGIRRVLGRIREVPLRTGIRLGLRVGLVRNIDGFGVQILPTLLLGKFGSTEWIAYLRIAQRVVNVARLFMQGISRTALPMFSEIAGLQELGRLKRAYWSATLFSGIAISLGILAVLPFLPWLITTMFPQDYHDPLWTIVLILVPGVMVASFSVANDTFYLVTDTLKVAIVISVVGVFVNSAIVTWLVMQNPTVGVAWGLSITFLTSVVHIAYAAWWFRDYDRRNRRPPAVPEATDGAVSRPEAG